VSGEKRKRPGWMERSQRRFYEHVQETPEAKARLRRSWFGRLMFQTLERQQDEWEPMVEADESIRKRTRAERITWLNQISPGWLILTDRRISFQPIHELSWAPWMIRTGNMPKQGLRVTKGRFLSRGIHFKPLWIAVGYLPGLLHTANLKVQHGRRAWWLRVERPQEWERAIAEVAANNL
jgi:hypothetical protein